MKAAPGPVAGPAHRNGRHTQASARPELEARTPQAGCPWSQEEDTATLLLSDTREVE